MKIIITILLVLFFFNTSFINSSILSETKKKPVLIQLNQEFYSSLLKSDALRRDFLLNELQSSIVEGVAYVESVTRTERYHRHFRITAIDKTSSNLNVRLYIFTDNEEYLTLLSKGDTFDFKGQYVIYTPLSIKRESYIFDIILEEGALNIK